MQGDAVGAAGLDLLDFDAFAQPDNGLHVFQEGAVANYLDLLAAAAARRQ